MKNLNISRIDLSFTLQLSNLKIFNHIYVLIMYIDEGITYLHRATKISN